MGFPTSMFTVLFAVARTVGWIAQWTEMMEDASQKIGRPRQVYTGAPLRDYVPVAAAVQSSNALRTCSAIGSGSCRRKLRPSATHDLSTASAAISAAGRPPRPICASASSWRAHLLLARGFVVEQRRGGGGDILRR